MRIINLAWLSDAWAAMKKRSRNSRLWKGLTRNSAVERRRNPEVEPLNNHSAMAEGSLLKTYSGQRVLLVCLLLSVCLAPALAQRSKGPRDPGSLAGADAGLTQAARDSLNTAVAALQANSLVEAERAARAAVA